MVDTAAGFLFFINTSPSINIILGLVDVLTISGTERTMSAGAVTPGLVHSENIVTHNKELSVG